MKNNWSTWVIVAVIAWVVYGFVKARVNTQQGSTSLILDPGDSGIGGDPGD